MVLLGDFFRFSLVTARWCLLFLFFNSTTCYARETLLAGKDILVEFDKGNHLRIPLTPPHTTSPFFP